MGRQPLRRRRAGRWAAPELSADLLQHSAVPTFVIDARHRVQLWNRACELLTGISAESVIGTTRHWAPFFAEPALCLADVVLGPRGQDNLSFSPYFSTIRRSPLLPEGLEAEGWYPDLNGRDRYLFSHAAPVRDRAGRVVAVVQTLEDLTDRRLAEEALRASERNYRELVESTNSIILRLDQQGRVVFCNDYGQRLFGYAREELLGRPLTETIVPAFESTGRDLHQHMAAICAEPDRYPLSENENITRDGGRLWVSWANKVLATVQGKATEILCIGQEITEKKRLQAQMIETEKMVTIGGLAAGMAHELNNPLGAIIQSAQNLRRRLSAGLAANEQVAAEVGIDIEKMQAYLQRRGIFEMLTHVTTAGARAADIIANLLAFSQKRVLGRSSVQLAELVERAIDLAACDYDLKKRYGIRDMVIERDYAPALPPVVVNGAEIEQVVFNLLKNAAQALAGCPADREPRIRVKVGRQDDFAFIEVADNGPGIPAAVRGRIYDPFFTTKRVGEGTGLGLSVSYAIVVQHYQGSIMVDSIEGEGARFTVRLPFERNGK